MSGRTPEVLFLCVHNAGRSQMAAALMEQHACGRLRVHSAGSEPADHLNPAVVAAMAELGLDITHKRPTRLTAQTAQRVDVVVTMGCGDACPVIRGTRYLDWSIPDPAGQPLEVVRRIRDEISRRVRGLAEELLTPAPVGGAGPTHRGGGDRDPAGEADPDAAPTTASRPARRTPWPCLTSRRAEPAPPG